MNDDVIVTSDAIDRLIATLQEHSKIAMVGPLLCHPDGSPTYTMYRWAPGWRDELARVRDRLRGTSIRLTLPEEAGIYEVGVLFAACALIETEFFRNIGGFNELFFVYGEDLDLCCRIASLGRLWLWTRERSQFTIKTRTWLEDQRQRSSRASCT